MHTHTHFHSSSLSCLSLCPSRVRLYLSLYIYFYVRARVCCKKPFEKWMFVMLCNIAVVSASIYINIVYDKNLICYFCIVFVYYIPLNMIFRNIFWKANRKRKRFIYILNIYKYDITIWLHTLNDFAETEFSGWTGPPNAKTALLRSITYRYCFCFGLCFDHIYVRFSYSMFPYVRFSSVNHTADEEFYWRWWWLWCWWCVDDDDFCVWL